MNLKQITDISQVKEVYTECMASIQDKISGSDVDADTKYLLDSIAQQTSYVLSSIIEYLENQ
jgi:hypothetical protein